MRPSRLIACLVVAACLSFPAAAKDPSALRGLPDDTASKLRETLGAGGLPSASALRRYLDDSHRDAGDDGDDVSVRNAGRAGGRLATRAGELASLREQAKQDLAAMKEAAMASGATHAAQRVDEISALVEHRFSRVEALFKDWQKAPTPEARQKARRALQGAFSSLRHDDIELPSTVPVPTLSPKRPAGEPGQRKPSAKLPFYAQAGEPSRRLVGFDGYRFIKVANTPPPVASEVAADCSAVAADLADDGKDVVLSPAIRDLAGQLGDV